MVHFDPPVSVKLLSETDRGALVRWKEGAIWHVGFCVIVNAEPLRKAIAVYEPVAHCFKWHYRENLTVVSYGGDVLLRPDIESFASDLAVTAADDTLYTLEGAPTLMVAVGNNDFRFLNLASGELQSRRAWPMMVGFRSWSAGVSLRDGTFVELLSVSSDSAFDEVSVQPERI
jgi:hypothetical protein